MSDAIRYERTGPIARVTIDRPEKKNAFVATMREELAFALDRAAHDADVRVVVLGGAGGAFSAGGDLDYLAELASTGDVDGLRRLLEAGAHVVKTIRRMEKPVIAAVDGVAAGAGCSLACACDFVIASDRSRLALSFVKIGFVPDWGATFFLPRRIGAARTFRLSSTGEALDAATALDWGLVDRVVPADRFEYEVGLEAERLAGFSATSLSFQKYLIGSEEIPALEDALAREAEAQMACFETEDFRRVMAERKAPRG